VAAVFSREITRGNAFPRLLGEYIVCNKCWRQDYVRRRWQRLREYSARWGSRSVMVMGIGSRPHPEVVTETGGGPRPIPADRARRPLTPRHVFTADASCRIPPLCMIISGYVISRTRDVLVLRITIPAMSSPSSSDITSYDIIHFPLLLISSSSLFLWRRPPRLVTSPSVMSPPCAVIPRLVTSPSLPCGLLAPRVRPSSPPSQSSRLDSPFTY